MESFDTKDCEISECFDRKFEKFPSKDSELEESANELSECFDRKFESFQSKDSGDTVRVSRNESKVDGRTRLRSVKQMEAYKRNFGKGGSIELRLRELDARMRHLQSLVLRLVRGGWI